MRVCIARDSQILFDQATLAEGGQLEDPAAFVKRLNELMLTLTGPGRLALGRRAIEAGRPVGGWWLARSVVTASAADRVSAGAAKPVH